MTFLDCQMFFNYIIRHDSDTCGSTPSPASPRRRPPRSTVSRSALAVCGCVGRDGRRIVVEDIQHSPTRGPIS